MSKKIALTGTLLIALSIILGAMAAHALETQIGSELILTFEKGVKYQMYTGLALLVIGLNSDKFNFKLNLFYLLNFIGVLLFSGGIYLYCMHPLMPGLKPIVHIVPIGGTTMIAAWIVLTIQLLKKH